MPGLQLLAQESLAKGFPLRSQAMARHDVDQSFAVQDTELDELDQAGMILGPSDLQHDGGKMLSAQHTSWRRPELHFNRLRKGFIGQRIVHRKKLDWPASNRNSLSLRCTPKPDKLGVDRRQRQQARRGDRQDHEDVEIVGLDWLHIAGCRNGAANRVLPMMPACSNWLMMASVSSMNATTLANTFAKLG